jgi:hypothetical protein
MRHLIEINNNPLGKKDIIALAQTEGREMVASGSVNILPVYVAAKRVNEYLTAFTKEVQDAATREAGAYGEKSFSIQGAKIEMAEVGVTYDYSHDEEWSTLQNIITEVKAKQKERENFLRALKQPMQALSEHGEVLTIQPPVKKSTTSLKVTL